MIGIAAMAFLINQARLSIASGLLQFTSRKYGVSFFGHEALAIYVALALGAGLLIGIGWRGLRHG